MAEEIEIATGVDESGQQVAYIDTGDGTYTQIPLSAVAGLTGMDSSEVMINLDQLNMTSSDGEEMVVIADENMDMATLESLIASGAVSTVQVDGNQEILQLAEGGLDGAQVIEVTPEQMKLIESGGQITTAPDGTTIIEAPQGFPGINNQSGVTYRCPSCPAMYANANAFTKHMREKHFVKVFTCRQCHEFFETLSQLFLHARRSHVDPRKPKRNPANFKFHCNQCNYMTNNGGTMEHHKRAHTGEKPYVCDVCNKRFAQKANMKTHRNRHIHRDRIFRCETCNKAFSSYDIYLAHLRTREHELREHFQMIASSQLNLECLGCTATFESIYNLNKHTRSCRIVRTLQTKFRCLPCDEYVTDVASLKAHVKSHEGSHIISCPVCGERGFPGFNQLNHHITRAHALKVNRRHVCRYCESTFETKKELDGHIYSMHAEERNARQSRGAVGRLKCRYSHCEFTTNSIMLLDRHHEQHRRQQEEGEDFSFPLPPARNATSNKRRGRPPKNKLTSEMGIDALIEEEEYDLEEEDMAQQNIIQRTITLVKSKDPHEQNNQDAFFDTAEDSVDTIDIAEFAPEDAENGENSLPSGTPTNLQKPGGVLTKSQLRKIEESNKSASQNAVAPGSSRRPRKIPSWIKDYDAQVPTDRTHIELPEGLVLEDPMDLKPDVPTEEWNIVVYDEEDIDDVDHGGIKKEMM